MTTKQRKVQELLNRLDVLEGKKTLSDSVNFLLEGEEVPTLKESAAGKAISQIANHVGKMRIDPRLVQLEDDLKATNENTGASLEELASNFSDKIQELLEEVRQTEERGTELTRTHTTSIVERLSGHEQDFSIGIEALKGKDSFLEGELKRLEAELPGIYSRIEGVAASTPSIEVHAGDLQAVQEGVKAQELALQELETNLRQRIDAFRHGGGNMNRNIAIGGNTHALDRYTDINLKAGANVTIIYAYNDQTKYTDITISATGGSGSGIVRSVNSVAVDTLAGAVPTTDYVYLASGTLMITLPTSVGNSNLYTIKNIGAGVITIVTTGGELIDGSANLILPLQFTSVDLISNNSGNWDIT